MPDPAPAQAPLAAPAAPVAAAIETLVAELEREQAWLTDLREDAQRAERTCQRLLAAVEFAIGTLPPPQARPFYQRIMRQRLDTPRMGRPPRDGRQAAVMDLLAMHGAGPIANAEIRAHLAQHGLKGAAAYVGTLLCALQRDEVVTRLSQGRYAINTNHPRLRNIRFAKHAAIEVELTRLQHDLARANAAAKGAT